LGLLVCCGGPGAVFLYLGYRTTNDARTFADQMQAEMDRARPNGPQDPLGGVKPPPGILSGGEAKTLDEALAGLRSTDAGRQAVALHWLSRQPVDRTRQAEVARALESVLSNAGNPATRGQAVSPLTVWADKDSVPVLAKVLNDAKP